MKKTVLLVMMVTLILGSFSLSAASYGVKGGINMANFSSWDGLSDNKMKLGMILGGFAEFEMSENLSIQPEALFTCKGMKEEYMGLEAKWNLSYLDIPVLVKYKFGSAYMLAGPYFGFKMSAKRKMNGNTQDFDGAKGMDFGLTLGLGTQIKNFLVEARYSLGLAKVFEDEDMKNTGISILVGYKF